MTLSVAHVRNTKQTILCNDFYVSMCNGFTTSVKGKNIVEEGKILFCRRTLIGEHNLKIHQASKPHVIFDKRQNRDNTMKIKLIPKKHCLEGWKHDRTGIRLCGPRGKILGGPMLFCGLDLTPEAIVPIVFFLT